LIRNIDSSAGKYLLSATVLGMPAIFLIRNIGQIVGKYLSNTQIRIGMILFVILDVMVRVPNLA